MEMKVIWGDPNDTTPPVYQYAKFGGDDEWKPFIGTCWADCEIKGWPNQCDYLDITVQMEPGKALSGIWVPTTDMTKKGPQPQKMFGYEYLGNGHLYIESKSWEFGTEGKIRIFNSHPNDGDVSLKFGILCRPIIMSPLDVKLSLSIKGNGVNHTENYEFRPAANPSKREDLHLPEMQDMYDRFNTFEALNLTGKRNIVHPKQYFTIRGFSYIVKEYFDMFTRKGDEYILAYIGTDTTENIRSLFRSISDNNWQNNIKEVRCFYTTDWDEEFLDYIEFENEIKESYPNIEFHFNELSDETARLQEGLEECDIVISTYVAPWIGGESRDQFTTLLKNIMGDSSYLLTVDPQTGQHSVRSELYETNINNDLLFKEKIGLISAKSAVTSKNNSVEWAVWMQPKGGRNS